MIQNKHKFAFLLCMLLMTTTVYGASEAEYKKLAKKEENVIFGGRLGEYKYYDMDSVIAAALEMCEKELV